MKKYNWGIIGLGEIAHQFASGFSQEQSVLYGVASRSLSKAKEFAKEYTIQQAYDSYEAMLADPAIDCVYVAVPNQFHHAHILQALKAGKHVLCEKAITLNQAELEEAVQTAKDNQVILQEAMTIFNMPLFKELNRIIQTGKLGKLKMIQAPFGSYKEPDPTNRFFNPQLAGGALLDIGIYAVSFVRQFMTAPPTVVASDMLPFKTGVDEQSITILRNEHNEMAVVTLTFQAKMPKIGVAAFENGYITVADYPRADQAEIFYVDGTKEFIESGNSQNALNYEVDTMIQTIEGQPNHSLHLTQDVIQVLDQMQTIWRSK